MAIWNWRASIGLALTAGLSTHLAMAGVEPFEERLATFPKINAVKDVDWYAPLEIARGHPAAPLAVAGPAEQTIAADALGKAIDYVDARGTVALLVWQGGKLQLQHYGSGYGPASLTDTASMNKSVMAILYGAALRDGFIHSIDEPAARYLPEWASDDRSKITIRNLMTMASGLDDPSTGMTADSPMVQLLLSNDIARAALGRKAVAPPDTVFDYNNHNAESLGIILERATHHRYADYLSKTLLRPIGAGDARVWLDRPGGMAHTFCCLQLTAESWLRIGLLLKDHGRALGHQVIPAAWIDSMTRPSAQNPNYGLQIWMASPHVPERVYKKGSPFKILAKEPFDAADMVFFDGWGAQRVYVSRQADLVIVRVGDVAMDWDDSFLPNVILRGLKRHGTDATHAGR
jgi:CubicO group peptidase (beta-lactamase class C family)